MFRGRISNWMAIVVRDGEPLTDIEVDSSGFRFTDRRAQWKDGEETTLVDHREWRYADMPLPYVARQMNLSMTSTSPAKHKGHLKEEGWEVDIGGNADQSNPYMTHFVWVAREDADRFVLAVKSLIADAKRSTSASEETDFHAMADAWRALPEKPPFPENARRQKVLAEAAFLEKDFDGAVEHYREALAIVPTWPEGNFNLALLLGEQSKDYRSAIRYMNRYLLLRPEAADAPAAKDKILVWQDRLDRRR